jgi:Kef-type K+ transport system membrane component KefB
MHVGLQAAPRARAGTLKTSVVYGLMIVATIGIFLMIRQFGETLSPPGSAAVTQVAPAQEAANADILFHVLLALAAVLVAGQVLGKLFSYLGQPPVIGEVVAGICLGPSLLGRIAPGLSNYVLPVTVVPHLGIISQVGIILYMFMVGLELNPAHLRERAHVAMATSFASVSVPFLLASALAILLYPLLASPDVPFTTFALFLGVTLSITALPVLARILTDRRLHKSSLGVIALTCAATNDLFAWSLLVVAVGIAKARMDGALWTIGLTIGFIGIMLLLVRPLVVWLLNRYRWTEVTPRVMALAFLGMLLASLTSEYIGIHAIFGAFLLGALIPHDSIIAQTFTRKLEDLVTVLLLPAFFAFNGMRTEIGLVSGVTQWLLLGVIIAVATAGMFGGTYVAARMTGIGRREAASLGVLMNCRGLMELVVLNIGLDLGVISPTLFAMLVLMALVSTMATAPILQLLTSQSKPEPAGRVVAVERTDIGVEALASLAQ